MEQVRKGGTTYLDRQGREISREEYERLQSGVSEPRTQNSEPGAMNPKPKTRTKGGNKENEPTGKKDPGSN